MYFRAAFFKGQVEQVSHDRRLWKPRTMNVSIGIGREGITIFRESNTVSIHGGLNHLEILFLIYML